MKPTTQPVRTPKYKAGLLIVLLLGFALAAYWRALLGGFIWDDDAYVTKNQTLTHLSGLWEIWFNPSATQQYYPLVHTSFWVEYHLWGLNPLGFHAVNIVLHVISSLLLWRVLAVLQLRGAWLAAAIFALHPVQVESVAWVTERKNILSAVFYFSAAMAYLRYRDVGNTTVTARQRYILYGAAYVFFLAALFSKTVACSLPAALLLVLWWKHGGLERRDILALTPFFLSGLGLGLGTIWLERYHAGASGAEWSLTFVERCLIAGRALWFYVGKLVCPVRLTFIYPRWDINPWIWWQWLYPAAAFGVVATLWFLRRRIGRGPLVAVLFFGGTLFPALGFINTYPMRYSFVADHFQYLACVGMLSLGATWLYRFPKAVLAVLLLTLASLTWHQAASYQNLKTLWKDTLDRNPQCWMAHNNLGMILKDEGDIEQASAHYQEALRLNPQYAESHYNLGIIFYQRGQVDEALGHFQETVRLTPDDPEAHNNYGAVLRAKGRFDEAIVQFKEAFRLNPDYTLALINLARTLEMKKAAP